MKLRTSAGIVIFDTLNNGDEAKTYVVGGLTKLGLNPRDIKFIIITHGHADHSGGATYLHDTYGAYADGVQPSIGTQCCARPRGVAARHPVPALEHGLDITDEQKFTLGESELAGRS